MRKIFTGIVASLVVLTALAAQSQAGLVAVKIQNAGDNYSASVGGFTLSNSQTNSSGPTGVNASNWFVNSGFVNPTVATYSITPGGFGQFFDAGKSGTGAFTSTENPNANASFDGFRLVMTGTAKGSVSDGITTFNYDGSGPHTFLFRTYLTQDPTSVSFEFTQESGTLTFSSLHAVPEPSALMLVGSLVGLGLVRRRR
jgi:hypothetical protein